MLTNTRDQHEVLVDVEDINTLKKKHEREENNGCNANGKQTFE